MSNTDPAGPAEPEAFWAPYAPDAKAPWDLRRVAHLHRRAAFSATWDELQRDLKDGPDKSIERLLTGAARADKVSADFAAFADTLARLAADAGDVVRLKAWWFYRMLFSPDPLGERLTLLWHDHFATSAEKVRDVGLMRGQNDTLRKHARGRFGELLNAAVRDPALLLYLDAPANRKGKPNENLARELMELFTLGVGNYDEADVKEAARCLTGWTVEGGRFAEDGSLHDGGEKTVLGKAGKWSGSDLVRVLLDHPATADRLAAKLCRAFFGEKAVASEAVKALAAGLRARQLDVGWAVGTVFRSRLFFAEANLGTRVLGPVEFVVGAARALELFDPAPNTLALADVAAGLGQDLFYPPNVGGWPGGRDWVGTRALIGRHNFAVSLLDGERLGLPGPADAAGLARRHGRGATGAAVVGYYSNLLLGGPAPAGLHKRLVAAAGDGVPSAASARRVVTIILASAEGQLA